MLDAGCWMLDAGQWAVQCTKGSGQWAVGSGHGRWTVKVASTTVRDTEYSNEVRVRNRE